MNRWLLVMNVKPAAPTALSSSLLGGGLLSMRLHRFWNESPAQLYPQQSIPAAWTFPQISRHAASELT